MRLRPARQHDGRRLFTNLTRQELLVLSATTARAVRTARMAVMRARSLPGAWSLLMIASSLADILDEAEDELARR